MLFTLLYHSLGYRPHREEIKNIIEIDDDLETASIKLNDLIVGHDSYKESFSDDETINLDNLSLHHAQDHLNAFINSDQETQKSAAATALDES